MVRKSTLSNIAIQNQLRPARPAFRDGWLPKTIGARTIEFQ